MPKFEITAPDGKRFEITAPEGATQDQVLEYAKSQWGKAQKEAAQPPKLSAEDTPGIGETLLIAAGRTFDRIGKGMRQLVASGPEAEALKAQAASDDVQYNKLREARPFATGVGESLPSMIVPAGGAATLLGNAGRMAVAGALPGTLEYGTAGERAQRGAIGALAGAVAPLLGAGAKTAWSFAEPLFNKGREAIAGRVLNRVAGESAPNVVKALKGATELVPGSAPTAAQVAQSGGIAALERAAAAMNPEAYTQRAMQQSSARLNALRGIAGDEAAMAAAKADRSAASRAAYSAADIGVAPIDSMFKGLQMRPQFNAALARAQTLAKDKGLDDIFFRDAKGAPVALIGEGAHFIKKALDEAAEYGSTSYTGKTAASSAGKTNELFQTWLEKSVPEYAAGKAAFAEKSIPINRMQVGQALLDKAAPAMADFGALGRESGAVFANAVRNGDAVAAKATGMPGTTMANVLSQDQMALVQNIGKDLARKANSQDLGRGAGSDTFQKLSMSNIAQQSGMPRAVGGLLDLPGVSRATSWAYRETDQKMQGLLSDALLNPAKAAQLMEKADKRWLQENPKTRQLLEQVALRGTGLLGMSAAPSLTQ